MKRDKDLDQLREIKDAAFNRMKVAEEIKKQSLRAKLTARHAHDRAYEAKQEALEKQDRAWKDLDEVRQNQPRIDELNRLLKSAYNNKEWAKNKAARARTSGQRGRASEQVGAYEQQYKECLEGRDKLVEEREAVKTTHEAARRDYIKAKSDFATLRTVYSRAKTEYILSEENFNSRSAESDDAKQAFLAGLEDFKCKRTLRNQELARQVAVPEEHIDNLHVTDKPDGSKHLYFGGEGMPDGDNHGHIVIDACGTVTYRRDPFESRGAHNYRGCDCPAK